jgi:hypothetical protein
MHKDSSIDRRTMSRRGGIDREEHHFMSRGGFVLGRIIGDIVGHLVMIIRMLHVQSQLIVESN